MKAAKSTHQIAAIGPFTFAQRSLLEPIQNYSINQLHISCFSNVVEAKSDREEVHK